MFPLLRWTSYFISAKKPLQIPGRLPGTGRSISCTRYQKSARLGIDISLTKIKFELFFTRVTQAS